MQTSLQLNFHFKIEGLKGTQMEEEGANSLSEGKVQCVQA